MNNSVYSGQFLPPGFREEPAIDDGRDTALGEVRKVLRHGPTTPGSLAKRARDIVDEAAIRSMPLTTAERRENGFDALEAVRKIHSCGPDGSGLLLPELVKVKLPPQDDDGMNTVAPASRAGAQTGVAMYQNGPSDNSGPPRSGPPQSASVSRRRAGPEDSDVEAPLKTRPDRKADLDAYKEGPLDVDDNTIKAIKRVHKAGPRRGW
jgi:hypothetical protein